MASNATARLDGDTLRLSGTLDRDAVTALWPQLAGAAPRRLDLHAVERIDSAGLALLAELSARHGEVELAGNPAGLAELSTAYRLSPSLDFNA